MRTLQYIARRIGGAIVVIAVIIFALFFIFYTLPSDPAQLSCGRPCSPDQLARVKSFMGLDKPWYQQMGNYVAGLFVGRTFGAGATAVVCAAPCLGYSFRLSEPVTTLIADRFPVTLSIALGAAVLWLLVGVFTGVLAARKQGTWVDNALMGLSALGISSPSYLIGLLAVSLFALRLGWLPAGGYEPLTQNPGGWLYHLILPWIVLALINAAPYTRIMRTQMLQEMGQDYVRTARSKGMPENRVMNVHVLRNASLPILTLFGLDLGSLLGGAVLTERVFSMQGIGMLLLDAVDNLDLQVLVGTTLFAAVLVGLANLVVDICYSVLDPRVTLAR